MPNDSSPSISRRQMMHRTAFAAGLTAITPAVAQSDDRRQQVNLGPGSTILFQGDSVTDVNRDRRRQAQANDSAALGRGYPLIVASELLRDGPKRGWNVLNRGISGNRVPHLEQRWQADCIELKPDLVSILIGVNDIWHKLGGRYDGTVASYREGYAALVERTQANLPKAVLVVCEPFVLRCGAVGPKWFPEFDERRAAAKEVAQSVGAIWIPFQDVFDRAVEAGSKPSYWAGDGVHPTLAGHALMAQAWRQAVGF